MVVCYLEVMGLFLIVWYIWRELFFDFRVIGIEIVFGNFNFCNLKGEIYFLRVIKKKKS